MVYRKLKVPTTKPLIKHSATTERTTASSYDPPIGARRTSPLRTRPAPTLIWSARYCGSSARREVLRPDHPQKRRALRRATRHDTRRGATATISTARTDGPWPVSAVPMPPCPCCGGPMGRFLRCRGVPALTGGSPVGVDVQSPIRRPAWAGRRIRLSALRSAVRPVGWQPDDAGPGAPAAPAPAAADRPLAVLPGL